ncbi:hypothetical protein GLOTRDRAFT_111623 [Gloeophyllum trabeum ATCC 11539]|uniref:Small nuclear ribonucleoprotein Prp3 C-terminal domain-containing protein n=1 Tax=Gloeophyllum trabeum (strain ATCC 11539 / FP-39264 / Madison 617) TaxID=670483 RepID=S7Q2S3_GLOTA|nr:uncharacterized protein GLOTRDRAFT_111623 [Gloeophyllum trabeum ATCC 11539]EPQ54296.1 hypothetical protein GLOTRDRAFT_111623 [Gloeophyllum trabeum ATCC 11539]
MPPADLRAVLFFHHISNRAKIRSLHQLTVEHSLRGYLKLGKPAVLVCQGEESDVDEYLKKVKSMRWQQARVEVKDHVASDAAAHIPANLRGLEEVATLSELTQRLRLLGSDWERWFKRGMGFGPR